MNLRTSLLLFLLAGACKGPSTDYLRVQARAHDSFLAAGDTVTVMEAGSPLVRGVVSGDGSLDLGTLGVFKVEGMRSHDLRTRLQREHGSSEVRIQAPAAGRVFVFGHVADPGRFSLGDCPTLATLVRAAHPSSELSDLRNVRVFRGEGPEGKELEFDVLAIERGGTDPLLMDGDIVLVPSTPLGHLAQPLLSQAEHPGAAVSHDQPQQASQSEQR